MFHPYGLTEIVPDRLYLSGVVEANNQELLRQSGITHVINLSGHDIVYPSSVDGIMTVMIDDHPFARLDVITHYFQLTNRFIDEALQNPQGRVLIHCFAGISRSVTVLVAYLMNQGLCLEEALQQVRQRRPMAQPNPGFLAQLLQIQHGICSVIREDSLSQNARSDNFSPNLPHISM